MNRNTEIARAVRHVLVMGTVTVAAAASLPATAQTQAQATEQDTTPLATVVVTGSRIPQPQLESVSPVTVVGSEEIAQTGTTRIEDILNQLPQVVADFGPCLSNGATGAATVSFAASVPAHPGAGQRPAPDAGRPDAERQRVRRHEPDPVRPRRAGRRADGRRVRRVRRRRRRGRRQLRDERSLRGRSFRCERQLQQPPQHNAGWQADGERCRHLHAAHRSMTADNGDFTAIVGANFADGRAMRPCIRLPSHRSRAQGARDFGVLR